MGGADHLDEPRYDDHLLGEDSKNRSHNENNYGAARKGQGPKAARPLPHVIVTIALPWLLFTLVLFLFLCAYREMPEVVWVVLILSVALSALFVFVGIVAKNRNRIFLALGLLSIAGAATGAAVGLFLDSEYMELFWRLENGVEYQKVNPTELSEATADASIIAFINETFIDDHRTVGFLAEGSLYCVAPVVLPPLYSSRVDYWAVGVDCCEKRRNFECGAGRNYYSLSGIVQEDTGHFRKAVETAVSVYNLVSVEQPQLVRFVDDVSVVKRDARDSAILIALSAISLHLCASALAGLLIMKALPGQN